MIWDGNCLGINGATFIIGSIGWFERKKGRKEGRNRRRQWKEERN